jgi:hypothetical protein
MFYYTFLFQNKDWWRVDILSQIVWFRWIINYHLTPNSNVKIAVCIYRHAIGCNAVSKINEF